MGQVAVLPVSTAPLVTAGEGFPGFATGPGHSVGTLMGIIDFWFINADGNQAKDPNPPRNKGEEKEVSVFHLTSLVSSHGRAFGPTNSGATSCGGHPGQEDSGLSQGQEAVGRPTTRKLGWMALGALETAGQ